MKTTSMRWTCSALALLLVCSGCANYRIKPDAASITPPRSPAPIPASVGITATEQNITGGFPDPMPALKKSLDESGLFQTVYYPVRSTDPLDGNINLRLNA